MARLDIPNRFVTAVYLRQYSQGQFSYVREPYNIVALDYGDGTPIQTYVEPNCGQIISRLTERQVIYNDVKFFDTPPFPKTRIGYGAPGQ